MDAGALFLSFVPVVSVAVGAGATYLWQVLGNRRTDKAVRIQTNARLMELTSFISPVYASRHLTAEVTPMLERLVTALDDMQIALAFRDEPDVLWKLGQIRVHCGFMMPQTADAMERKATDDASLEKQRETLQWYAGNTLALLLETMTDERMLNLALKISASFGFSQDQHKLMVLTRQGKLPQQQG